MNRISSVFTHKALIAYVTVGYPSMKATMELVPALAEWGCDIIELGIPFSDPLADGATIQEASYHALQNGVTPKLCLNTVTQLRQEVDIPIVFMSYYNPIFNFGLDRFCRASVKAGVDGFIIPDLLPEEGGDLEGLSLESGLDLIYFVAPTSSSERVDMVVQRSRGFLYLVSVTGVTGARESLASDLEGFVSTVRSKTKLPLCVGFGISTPQQAQEVARVADGVIVGSRIIQLLGDGGIPKVGSFIKSLRDVI